MAALTARSCRKIGPSFLLCSTLLLTLLHVRSVQAQDGRAVELELVLAVDTSLSISADEYAVQMGGLALAFRNPHVVSAIEAAGDNGIAVALVQWGIGEQQEITVDWTHVYDRASAKLFAHAIEATPRRFFGKGTGITHAVIHENHNFGTLRCRWVGAVHCIRSSHRASLSSSGLACRTLDFAISASGRSRSWRATAGSADCFSGWND